MESQTGSNPTFCHDPVTRERQVLAMVGNGQSQVRAISQRQPHQIWVVHRVAVVTEGYHSRSGQLLHLGQLFSITAFGDAADRIHADYCILPGTTVYQVHHRSVVDRRLGVGHAANCGKATPSRRTGTSSNGLFVLETGLAQVAMDVDKSWAGHQTVGFDDLASLGNLVGTDPVPGTLSGRPGPGYRLLHPDHGPDQ